MPLTAPTIFLAEHALLAGAIAALPAADIEAGARYAAARRREQFLGGRALARLAAEHATGNGGLRIAVRDERPHIVGRADLALSISHSSTLAACAVGACAACGIDVQRKLDKPLTEISQAFFTSDEHQALAALDAHACADVFYRWWTLKEAWVKASGAELMPSLARVRVASQTDVASDEWRGWSFAPDADTTGALVVRGGAMTPAIYVWTGTVFERATITCEPVALAITAS